MNKNGFLCATLAALLMLSGCVSVTVPPASQGPDILSTAPSASAPVTNPSEPTIGETAPDTQPTQAVTEPSLPETESAPPETEPPTEAPTEAPTPPPTQPPTNAPTETPTNAPTEAPTETPTVPNSGVAIPIVTTTSAPGTLVKSAENAVIDYSNTRDGYVMIRYSIPSDKRLKVQIKGSATSVTYTYNLTPEQWTAFPLSDENGTYQITVLQNITGSRYVKLLSLVTEVTLADEFAPFLRSNQFVNFDAAPKTQTQAGLLAADHADPLKKVEVIYNFVIKNLTYDRELATNVQSGYLPDLDRVLEKKSGICFDYAALMAGMLRAQGVPTKLVVGYAGEVYHAWISVWSEHTGWVDGAIYFDGVKWNRMDPTFASSGQSSPDIMDYIGNGSNYSAKYFY